MAKLEFKSLIEEMCANIHGFVDENEQISKEHIVDYLRNSADLISSITSEEVSSYQLNKNNFIEGYKEIAKQTLSSYENSNSKFTELASRHGEVIVECSKATIIDLPDITSKFTDIQTHMIDEVNKANSMITQLSAQVKELETKSNLDSLTKVFNRGALNTYLTKLCSQDNLKYDVHLLILDIDDFKLINDKYGHVAGDKILIFIANILKKTLRDGDKVFRYGGEEFVIILNRIEDEQCKVITNRILKLISGNKLIYKGQNIGVTISIGTTKYVNHDTPDTFIHRADKALYIAKNNGKNQFATEL